jgi:glyoxylase-like metal-dependent hydrolase (beta-lactamase superfamily II)
LPHAIDVLHLGRDRVICAFELDGLIVDPGPASCVDTLIDRLGPVEPRALLLTHIHLDHAGASGVLCRRYPNLKVYVHERGAPHLIDPAKLLASAARLYQSDMQRLWGEFLPVPESRVRVLAGGETIAAGGRELQVAYTPGHAVHHVSYFDRSGRIAFVGDTAGIRRGESVYVMPPTPPPDVDLEAWRSSADRILAWDPDTLFLTHFGPVHGARPHFEQLFQRLGDWSRIVRRLLADPSLDDAQREQRFVEEVMLDLRRVIGEAEAEQYGRAGRLDYSWQGLARYWRKKV